RSIAENGGDRLERLAVEIRNKEQTRQVRERKAQRYAELVQAVGETPAGDEAEFIVQRQRFQQLEEAAQAREASLQNDLTEHGVSLRQGKQAHDALSAEINSL